MHVQVVDAYAERTMVPKKAFGSILLVEYLVSHSVHVFEDFAVLGLEEVYRTNVSKGNYEVVVFSYWSNILKHNNLIILVN